MVLARPARPAWLDPTPDWRVVLFAVGMPFAAAILFGLAPALQVGAAAPPGDADAADPDRRAGRGQLRAADRRRPAGAGASIACMSADPGFEYRQVISINPGSRAHGYTPAQAPRLSGHAAGPAARAARRRVGRAGARRRRSAA